MKLRYRVIFALLILASGGCFSAMRFFIRRMDRELPTAIVVCSNRTLLLFLGGMLFWAVFCALFLIKYKKINPFEFSKPVAWFIVVAGFLQVVYFLTPIARYHYSGTIADYISQGSSVAPDKIFISTDSDHTIRLDDGEIDRFITALSNSHIRTCIPYSMYSSAVADNAPLVYWEQFPSISIYDPFDGVSSVQINCYTDTLIAIEVPPLGMPIVFYLDNNPLNTFLEVLP